MEKFKLTIKCENNHIQYLTIGGMSESWVNMYIGLLDGTSSAYIYPPGQDSVIGKCGICGKQITITVEKLS